MKQAYLIGLVLASAVSTIPAFSPNPLISRGKPVFASSGNVSILVDGKFKSGVWQVTENNSWAAINVGKGPDKVFFVWNCINEMWSDSLAKPGNCVKGVPVPTAYTLLVSANSTNGNDGDWTAVDSVAGNVVAARGHLIGFSGSSWVKILITGTVNSMFDEMEVFDVTNGADDTWFFAGTSITQMAFKSNVLAKNFGDYVTEGNSAFTPAYIRGGIGCITMGGLRTDIPRYMQIAGNVKHFCIEIGTNDAWGGDTSDLGAYTIKLQRLIDSCKAYGIEPIIARSPATDPAKPGWQINEGFLKAVDSLTKVNNLLPGPDFFNWFLQHPEELADDGIHPAAAGAASIQRLWAETALKCYQSSGVKHGGYQHAVDVSGRFAANSRGGTLVVAPVDDGKVTLFSPAGECIAVKTAVKNQPLGFRCRSGCYIVCCESIDGSITVRMAVRRD